MINERIVTNVKRRINFLKWNKSKEARTELRLITQSVNTRKASYWKPDTQGNGAKVGLLGSQFLY